MIYLIGRIGGCERDTNQSCHLEKESESGDYHNVVSKLTDGGTEHEAVVTKTSICRS